MLWVALGETLQPQAQLIVFGTELDWAVGDRAIGFRVIRFFEFDFYSFSPQRDTTDAGQLRKPAGDDRIHDKAVVGVIGANGIEPQPGASGVLMKTRLTAIVGAVQRLKADHAPRRFAYRRRLGCSHACQPGLAQAAKLAHAQTQGRVLGLLDGCMAQTHVARDRQAERKSTRLKSSHYCAHRMPPSA